MSFGLEGYLFKPIFFHSDKVIDMMLQILHNINEMAYKVVSQPESGSNPIKILDVRDVIEQTYGSCASFLTLVEQRAETLSKALLPEWNSWYMNATDERYSISDEHRQSTIEKLAKWRHSVCSFKYEGGKYKGGFMHYHPYALQAIPIH